MHSKILFEITKRKRKISTKTHFSLKCSAGHAQVFYNHRSKQFLPKRRKCFLPLTEHERKLKFSENNFFFSKFSSGQMDNTFDNPDQSFPSNFQKLHAQNPKKIVGFVFFKKRQISFLENSSRHKKCESNFCSNQNRVKKNFHKKTLFTIMFHWTRKKFLRPSYQKILLQVRILATFQEHIGKKVKNFCSKTENI